MPDSAPLPAPPPIDHARDALFLDFDGTLAAIADRPDEVAVEREMAEALARARAVLQGRVAVVSGRDIATLATLVGATDIAMAGVHGLERRSAAGYLVRAQPSSGLEHARAELAAVARREPRLLIEDKGLGIAIHYRTAPELEALARETARGVAHAHDLALQTGKMVFEVRDRGADKGAAVRAFMAEPPFAGSRPVFVGDDDTDECAFEVAGELGGFGVLVGAPRATAARYGLYDVAAVRGWLASVGAPA